jgi:ribosome maturation factor RimP
MDMQEQETLLAELEPLLAKQGIAILELAMSRHHGGLQVRATVFAASGTGTAECSKAHRAIQARLLESFGIEGAWIEVASPGIDREMKSSREYALFAGERVRILREGDSEWIKGRLAGVEGESVRLETRGGSIAIPIAEIGKAKLDSTPEGD